MKGNHTIILRSIGERTECLCKRLILDQGYNDSFYTSNEKPFWKALVRSFELGIEANREFTLCIDADILLFSNAIADMTYTLQQSPPSTFGITGMYYDKFFNRPKYRGVHLYRTEYLRKAISFANQSGEQIRPETYTKGRMEAEGHKWISSKSLFGIHDFGQYYRDIFRKLVVRFVRSSDQTSIFRDISRFSRWDNDFLVALWGINYAQANKQGDTLLDSDYWVPVANAMMKEKGLTEKPALVVNDLKGLQKRVQMLGWIQKYKMRRFYPMIHSVVFRNIL
jgi:hypothetical protein